MEKLQVLESKVHALVNLFTELKVKLQESLEQRDILQLQNNELRDENMKLATDYALLEMQLSSMRGTAQEDNQQINALNHEKTEAKKMLDELIRTIDTLACEKQV
jgi:regulator of replication initiation timing